MPLYLIQIIEESFEYESDPTTDNGSENGSDHEADDGPQAVSFPGLSIHHGADPETYKCHLGSQERDWQFTTASTKLNQILVLRCSLQSRSILTDSKKISSFHQPAKKQF